MISEVLPGFRRKTLPSDVSLWKLGMVSRRASELYHSGYTGLVPSPVKFHGFLERHPLLARAIHRVWGEEGVGGMRKDPQTKSAFDSTKPASVGNGSGWALVKIFCNSQDYLQ